MAATIKIIVDSDSGGIGKIKNDISDLGNNAKNAGGGFTVMKGLAVNALTAVAGAVASAAASVAGFVKDSVSAAGSFEANMNQFQAAANLDTTGLEEFQDLFLQLGKELPVSTLEVQEAAITLVKAGIDPAVIRAGALRDSLQFAAAAGMDLAGAAELTTKMLGTFVPMGASVEEQTRFMADAQNLLVKAANASTLDVDRLGDAMLQAAGAAKGAGIEYQDFVTTMGLISPAFGSAAEAGTSFKNLVARFIPSTKKATGLMFDLGLITEETGNRFFDASGKFLGMRNASQVLQDAFAGLSDAERTEALSTLFGNDAKGAAMALISAGAEQYDLFAQKMADANGVQQQAAATQQGFNFAMENMKGSIEALQITIGMALLPVLSDLINNYLTPGINAVMGIAEAFIDAGPMSSEFGEAMDVLGQALGLPANLLQNIVFSVQEFITQATAVLSPIAAFVMQSEVLAPVLFGIGTALAVAVVPALVAAVGAFLSAAAPIAALVAAGALLYQAWTTDFLGIQTLITTWWTETLQPAFAQAQTWLAANLPIAIQTLSAFWTGTLVPAMQQVWAFLNDYIFPVISTLVEVWIAVAKVEIQALAALWTGVLQPALSAVWSFIQDFVLPIWGALFNVAFAVAETEVKALSDLWNTVLQPALSKVWSFIQDKVIPIFESVTKTISDTVGPILTKLSEWLGTEIGRAHV